MAVVGKVEPGPTAAWMEQSWSRRGRYLPCGCARQDLRL